MKPHTCTYIAFGSLYSIAWTLAYTCKHYETLYIQYVLSKLKYLKIKLDWGLRVPFRSACLYLYMIVHCRRLLALSLSHWPHIG